MADHFFVNGWCKPEPFKSHLKGGGPVRTPNRDREEHGAFLKAKFEEAKEQAQSSSVTVLNGCPEGLYIQFESDKAFDLDLDKLDLPSKGIELVSVAKADDTQFATVFVPTGAVDFFIQRFEDYIDKEGKTGKPKNRSLVESVADLRLATLESFWTDDKELFPDPGVQIWWEIWLRTEGGSELEFFQRVAKEIDLVLEIGHLAFPDRIVVLCQATREQLSQSLKMLNYFAELRKAKELPNFFLQLRATEQSDWIKNLSDRCQFIDADATAVCILDTGVTRSHPLLASSLNASDVHAHKPHWRTDDHDNHGTEMAGVSLFGDLAEKLVSKDPIQISHRLESVKILPPPPEINDPVFYGVVTADATAQTEIAAPKRNRVFLMAVSAPDQRDRGMPSSWSSEIDSLASSADDQESGVRRLFVLSAGNREFSNLSEDCFNGSIGDSIHDPGQSWNALTVGAYTQRAVILEPALQGWRPLARPGELAPTSTTSRTWASQWPIKPEVVAEGGNYAISPSGTISSCDSLSLLTTHRRFPTPFFSTTGDTSGAAANVANMAAIIAARYPDMWPETIRAIIIHSARWTAEMTAQAGYDESLGRKNIETLLRCFGFGGVNLARALESSSNALTMIAQEKIFPYEKDKSKDMMVHALPWPVQELSGLGATEVKLRVTLSYFVEPNPGRRGYSQRHRYASHGLRFDVNKPTEKLSDFRARLNKQASDESTTGGGSIDSDGWALGHQIRSKGSIHSDVWTGTAIDLASRGFIGVYPVIGWWRERHQLNKWQNGARYSLVVSIETSSTDVDLYVPVRVIIKNAVPVAIEIET